jgi:hypothetical protein
VDKDKGIKPWSGDYVSPWFPSDEVADPGRVKFLKLIHVTLSDPEDQELGDIFEYASGLLSPNNRLTDYYRDSSVIPSAMFPGSLEGPEVQVAKGGTLIERNFEREQKNKNILMTRLARRDGIRFAVENAKLGWQL